MKNKKILVIGLCGAICLSIAGVTYASALASDTPKVSTSETGNTSGADILYQDTDGGQISVDGKNWVAEADYSCISEDGKKLFAPEKEVIGTCPRCGQPVYEGKKNFACSDRSCGFVLWKNDRFWTSRKKELTKKMATDLLKKGRTNVKGMWSEKKQATYDAAVILDDTGGKYINFKLEFPKKR